MNMSYTLVNRSSMASTIQPSPIRELVDPPTGHSQTSQKSALRLIADASSE